jgi:hypothetical protein
LCEGSTRMTSKYLYTPSCINALAPVLGLWQ